MDEASSSKSEELPRIQLARQVYRLYQTLNRYTGGWLAILKDAYLGFQQDECAIRAAAIAYRAIFSVFPLALLLFALSSSLLARPEIRSQVIDFILQNLQAPELAGDVITQANLILEERETVSILALIGFLWGSSGVFSMIDDALNAAWNVRRPRPFWRSKVIGLFIALLVTVLFLLSIATTAVVNASKLLPQIAAVIPFGEFFAQATSSMLPIAITFTMFLMLYKLLPYTIVSWRSVTLGALLATVLWQLSNSLYSIYVARLVEGRYSLVYGPFGAVILFLLWIYFSSVILLIGAELAGAYSKHRDVRRQVELSTAETV